MRTHAVDCDLDEDCSCHPFTAAQVCDWCGNSMDASAEPTCVNPSHHAASEWQQCLGCGESYDPFEESHAGHSGGVE